CHRVSGRGSFAQETLVPSLGVSIRIDPPCTPDADAFAFATTPTLWLLGPRDLFVVGRRSVEHRHRRPRELAVPESARADEDRSRGYRHPRRPVIVEDRDLDLALEHVEQLVAVGMPLPRRQPRVA